MRIYAGTGTARFPGGELCTKDLRSLSPAVNFVSWSTSPSRNSTSARASSVETSRALRADASEHARAASRPRTRAVRLARKASPRRGGSESLPHLVSFFSRPSHRIASGHVARDRDGGAPRARDGARRPIPRARAARARRLGRTPRARASRTPRTRRRARVVVSSPSRQRSVARSRKARTSRSGATTRRSTTTTTTVATVATVATNNIVAACVNATSVDERRPDVAPPSSAGTPLVFVTAEVSPWSKTGGLGDVCGALPAALAARGHSVVVVAPLYEPYDDVHDTGHSATFALNPPRRDGALSRGATRRRDVPIREASRARTRRRREDLRVGARAPVRRQRLSVRALEFGGDRVAAVRPWGDLFFGGGEDAEARRRNARFDAAPVFVANDWHAALVPVFLAARYQAAAGEAVRPRHWAPEGARAAVARATTVTIVHNLFHLESSRATGTRMLGLPEENTEWFPALRWRWNDGGESMNFLKAGLATSQAAVLVSPSYANEVQTNELGCGMDKVLRSVGNFGSEIDLGVFNGMSGKLKGIVNGIDDEEWNPATERAPPAKLRARRRRFRGVFLRAARREPNRRRRATRQGGVQAHASARDGIRGGPGRASGWFHRAAGPAEGRGRAVGVRGRRRRERRASRDARQRRRKPRALDVGEGSAAQGQGVRVGRVLRPGVAQDHRRIRRPS